MGRSRRGGAGRESKWGEEREAELLEEAGRYLRNVRVSAGYTQAEAANQLGVDQSAVAKIEAGERPLSIVEAVKLKGIYNVSSLERLVLPDLLNTDEKTGSLEIVDQPSSGLVRKKAMEIKQTVELAMEHNGTLVSEGAGPTEKDVLELSCAVLASAEDHERSFKSVQAGYEVARSLLRRLEFPGLPLGDLETVCERLGIVLIKYPLGYERNQNLVTFGAAAVSATCEGYIVVNSEVSRHRQQWLIAGLLGRLVLGHCKREEILFSDHPTLVKRDEDLDRNSINKDGQRWGFAHELLMSREQVATAVEHLAALTSFDLPDADERIVGLVRLAAYFGYDDFMEAARHIGFVLDDEQLQLLGFADHDTYSEAIHQAFTRREGEFLRLRTGRAETAQPAALGEIYISPIVWSRAFRAVERKVVGVERLAELLFTSLRNAEDILDDMRSVAGLGER